MFDALFPYLNHKKWGGGKIDAIQFGKKKEKDGLTLLLVRGREAQSAVSQIRNGKFCSLKSPSRNPRRGRPCRSSSSSGEKGGLYRRSFAKSAGERGRGKRFRGARLGIIEGGYFVSTAEKEGVQNPGKVPKTGGEKRKRTAARLS